MAIDPNNTLLNGPKRAVRTLPLKANRLPVVEDGWVAYRPEKKPANWHPNCECPEPDSPEFDSRKHGLLAPPKTKYIRIEPPLVSN